MPRINGTCIPPMCFMWEIKDVKCKIKLDNPPANPPPDSAFIDILTKDYKSGVFDCDADCNCNFFPGQDSTWQDAPKQLKYDEVTVNGTKYKVGCTIEFKFRMFMGTCAPLGSKIHWHAPEAPAPAPPPPGK